MQAIYTVEASETPLCYAYMICAWDCRSVDDRTGC